MSVTFTPAQIEQFKLHAKHTSRETNTSHSEALNQIAREHGFNNWSLLIKQMALAGNIQRPPAIAGEAAPMGTPVAQASASSTVDRLVAIGFKQVGRWSLTNQVLRLELKLAVMHEQNVLYAFVVDNALMYIGKTTQSLIKRMQGYRSQPAMPSMADRPISRTIATSSIRWRPVLTSTSTCCITYRYSIAANFP